MNIHNIYEYIRYNIINELFKYITARYLYTNI